MEASNRRVVINVGGVRFETYTSTLQTFPATKLANLAESMAFGTGDYDSQRNEFFFDRNPVVFGYVLDYYRTKRLHCSDDVCKSVLIEELHFWEVDTTQLAHCCWLKVNNKMGDLEDLGMWDEMAHNDQQQLLVQTDRVDYSWRARWQPKIWGLFEMPFSSLTSMCVTAVSLIFTIAAIVIFFEETKQHFAFVANHTQPYYHGYVFLYELDYQKVSYLLYLELVCVFWFLFEFCTRFFFCPDKKKFTKNLLNWVDFISLLPVFVELLAKGEVRRVDYLWKILGFVRTVYILKLIRIIMHIEGSLILRVLSGTLRAILREIFILLLVLAFETLFYAALVFYAEWSEIDTHNHKDFYFEDIYSCCWWAIITLTTVGYGDVHPTTTFGKIVSGVTAISGIMTIVIPIPILMIKFQHYYSIALASEKLKLHRHNQQKL
ncbi:potassium voltage-gated channel subfamily C member 1-like [Spea bombifrons]|uniref:potassium voltage-gated channel subfamily C member 1-like n=1 Tax=Spea bombifrons TaxID=233779 RepID=UPI00234AD069|nr:potassium voltage-gated channel subfamily C member 1-like [Spea bombifrons]